MPSRERNRRKTKSDHAARTPVNAKLKRRQATFEREPWYAEASRHLSAARKAD